MAHRRNAKEHIAMTTASGRRKSYGPAGTSAVVPRRQRIGGRFIYERKSNYSTWQLAHVNPDIQGIRGQIPYYYPVAGATDETRLLDAAISENLERLGFTDE